MTKLAAKNKAEGDAFLAKNKTAPGVKTTASGLQYQVISQGTGARPGPNDTVEINYTGTFVDGQVFDASAKHNPPGAAKIPLAGVIPGFREGLQLMQVAVITSCSSRQRWPMAPSRSRRCRRMPR